MTQIQRKTKLKSCFENLKGHVWKSRRKEKNNNLKVPNRMSFDHTFCLKMKRLLRRFNVALEVSVWLPSTTVCIV